LNITNVTVSDEDAESYNRIWYEIGTEGYAYSGNVQPVKTLLNTPQKEIPTSGVLAEVSVPFTDGFEKPDSSSKSIFRLYYETVHWVLQAYTNAETGRLWYQLLDDKYRTKYYVPAEHLRLIPDAELAPISADVPEKDKRIEVHLDQQLMFAFEDTRPVFAARISSGGIYRTGVYSTPAGHFMTYYKRPTRHMAAGDIASNGFDLPGVPWVLYITESGISFHGTYWHNDFGTPHSHGCINMSPSSAKWLYLWSTPEVKPYNEFSFRDTGTKVFIK
jgi:lipoprotein-anchoring transpeptidase ErfK/SrfK